MDSEKKEFIPRPYTNVWYLYQATIPGMDMALFLVESAVCVSGPSEDNEVELSLEGSKPFEVENELVFESFSQAFEEAKKLNKEEIEQFVDLFNPDED